MSKSKNIIGSAIVQHQITEQQFADMLCTAFDGGITYWCDKVEAIEGEQKGLLSDDLASGAVTTIRVHDSEVDQNHFISRDSLIEAFTLMAQEYPKAMTDFLSGYADAETADIWFQLAVFCEVVYG